jgi:peptidoglycan hydrolase-like protein with peptidoglycan-binding domain
MTLSMPDSVTVANLPDGYPAYLGYTDGKFNTAAELRRRFPAAELVLLTATGENTAAHGARVAAGADSEPGDLTAAAAVALVQAKAELGLRPVIYASTVGAAGYGMPSVLAEMRALGIDRQDVRLLSAHYGDGLHICGPHTCRLIDVEMDGTQWTSMFKGLNGSDVDMSMLADDFFTALPDSTETERLVQELGIVRQGMAGGAVKTVQALCNARMPIPALSIDGAFGPATFKVVAALQARAKITADGVVGPQTWPVLLGVA